MAHELWLLLERTETGNQAGREEEAVVESRGEKANSSSLQPPGREKRRKNEVSIVTTAPRFFLPRRLDFFSFQHFFHPFLSLSLSPSRARGPQNEKINTT
jgi:hypothetical protein